MCLYCCSQPWALCEPTKCVRALVWAAIIPVFVFTAVFSWYIVFATSAIFLLNYLVGGCFFQYTINSPVIIVFTISVC